MPKNSIEFGQTSTILDVLADQTAREHMQRMFYIGAEMHQESGFAAYQVEGGHSVSKLVVPDIDEIKDLQAQQLLSSRVDLIELIRKQKHLYSLSDEEWRDDEQRREFIEFDQQNELDYVPSQKAKRRIDSINASGELDEEDKSRLIEAIRRKDLDIKDNVRSDLIMMAHNHPQIPAQDVGYAFQLGISDLTVPSTDDLRLQEYIQKYNPGVIQMIIGATRDERQVILFTGAPGAVIDANRYEASVDFRKSTSGLLGKLSCVGIAHCLVSLTKDAKLTSIQQKKVEAFVKELEA